MKDLATLERGRSAFEQRAWAEACRLLHAVDRDAALDPDDLERLAIATYLVGHDEDCEALTTRAHQGFLQCGNHEAAARTAFWLGFSLMGRGSVAPASGWFARASRLLDEGHIDSVVRGYLLIPNAIRSIVQGDPSAADAMFGEAAAIARRFGDDDLASIACHGRGRALIRLGRIREGAALLDEAMASVIAGQVRPIVAGDVYCSVLEGCQETFDLRRASEWTSSLAQWCAAQPDLVRYRGECLQYRAEVLQLRGQWDAAARDAEAACALLASRPSAGSAFYRRGDLHRLRGEFNDAEESYRRAHERGRTPQPGLSLLRLAQGQVDAAAASIRSALVDTTARARRAAILPAAVDILVAAGDVPAARDACAELSQLADAIGAPLLAAASAQASGEVLLAEGDMDEAARYLRRACESWRELGVPYEEARTSVSLATISRKRGDEDSRRLQLDAARRIVTELEAEPCLARLADESSRATHHDAGPLSEREAQVLRLLAAGKTNRAIGDELFISEKTVARHVSNIFNKIGASSRAGATAWAFQHHLI